MPFDAPAGSLKKLYGTISKVEDNPDGTITVYGIASSNSRDGAGEIVHSDAMKAALPDYSKFPALREMHQSIAAGRVVEADVDEDGITNIAALVVDPTAILKVKTGVYAGFSIGGKVTKRDSADRTIITGLRLVEISLVDSPCNPDASISMWKAAMTDFIPPSADVVARAKTLAKAAGTAQFRDFLFEAREELISEEILKVADAEAEAAPEVVAEVVEPDKEAAAEAETVVEAPAAEVVEETADKAADPDEDDGAGEGAVEDVVAAAEAPKEAAETVEGADQAPDAADALAQALAAAGDAAKAAAAPVEVPEAVVETPLREDFEKFAKGLKGIGVGPKEGADVAKVGDFEVPADVAKSLYSVSRFADLLQSLCYLHSSVSCENDGDDSTVAADLGTKIKELGALLVTYASEEVAELVSMVGGGEPVVEVIYCGEDVECAQAVVDATKADEPLMEKAATAVAARAAPEVEKVEGPTVEELTAENERLTKALADAPEAVVKITADFTEVVDALKAEVADLQKRFNDEPLPPKTAGPLATVSKAADSTGQGNGGGPGGPSLNGADVTKYLDSLSEEERGMILVKAALQQPRAISVRRTGPAAE
jgi:HK97 family phage prohead protease